MNTELKSFFGTQFIGKPVLADIEFFGVLEKINQLAKTHQLQIHVIHSARQQGSSVPGAIVKPASRSNHLVGHAIDMNIKSSEGFFNSKALKNSNFDQLPANIQAYITAIRNDSELRWGGDFNDPVHIDDGLNINNSKVWDEKFPIIQADLLNLFSPSVEPNSPRLLFLTRPVMQGGDVSVVQQKLINKGANMNEDGFFGSITDSAVTTFQEQAGLSPDGIVGPEVRKKLGI